MKKKLYRSNTNEQISGVCGGLAEYLNIDVSFIRIVWILSIIFGCFGFYPIIIYLICSLIIPTED